MTTIDQPLAQFVDRHTMTYERRYPHPIDRVWDAVSTGEHLSVWLLPVCRVERRAGGRATFTWGGPEEDGVEVYEVRDFEPPRLITFAADGLPSWMRFELSPDGDDSTVLRFTLHWPIPADANQQDAPFPGGDLPAGGDTEWRPAHLSGFHGMLDNLAGFLDGTWSEASMDAMIAQLTSGNPPPADHLALMEAYRVHIREHCPPA